MRQGVDTQAWGTEGASWPDFYAMIEVAPEAASEEVRRGINALYAEATANSDHRDLPRRFHYQTLQEKVLPQARRILLDEGARRAYDEQRSLHLQALPQALPYPRFVATLPPGLSIGNGAASETLSADEAAALPIPPRSHAATAAAVASKAKTQAESPASTSRASGAPFRVEDDGDGILEAEIIEAEVIEAEVVEAEPAAASPEAARVGEAHPAVLKASRSRAGRTGSAAAVPDRAAEPISGGPNAAVLRAAARASNGAIVKAAPEAPMALPEAPTISLPVAARSTARPVRQAGALGAGAVLLAAGLGWSVMHLGNPAEDKAGTQQRQQAPPRKAVQSSPGSSVQSASPNLDSALPLKVKVNSLLRNASFEGEDDGRLDGWTRAGGPDGAGGGAVNTIRGAKPDDAHAGRYRLSFYSRIPYQASIWQTVQGLKPGLYRLTVWIKRSGAQTKATMAVSGHGGPPRIMPIPLGTDFHDVTMHNIRVTSGRCRVEFATQAPAQQWMDMDAVELRPEKK